MSQFDTEELMAKPALKVIAFLLDLQVCEDLTVVNMLCMLLFAC